MAVSENPPNAERTAEQPQIGNKSHAAGHEASAMYRKNKPVEKKCLRQFSRTDEPQDRRNTTAQLTNALKLGKFMYIDHNPDTNSRADRKALDGCPFLPFALAEAAAFSKKHPGSFDLNELQSVAVEALLRSPMRDARARKAITGALNDFARDGLKVVRDIEITEEEFERTHGGPPSNARLLAGPGKASSKHGKVRLALGRARFNDEWSQKPNPRAYAKVNIDGDGDDAEAADPRGGNISVAGTPTAAKPEHIVVNPNRRTTLYIRRTFVPPDPYIGIGPMNQRTPRPECGPGRRMWAHIPDLDGAQVELLTDLFFDASDTTGSGAQRVGVVGEDFGRKREKSGFRDLELHTPKLTSCEWHREAPRHRWDDDKNPACWWGLPDVHPGFAWTFVPGFAPVLAAGENGFTRRAKIFSPAAQKNPVRGELIYEEEDAPNHPSQTTAAGGGSPTGRGAFHLPTTSKPRRTRRAAIVVRLRQPVKLPPPVAPAQPLFCPDP